MTKENPQDFRLRAVTTEFIAAWDERKRLFDTLRNPNLTDDHRAEFIDAYVDAASHFDKVRADFIKLRRK